ncbi:MAG TPA: SCO family protein [Solirubrobacteraceae bacterium]|nr:SCO family protein [Solirubrobacteraceae bacterium]
MPRTTPRALRCVPAILACALLASSAGCGGASSHDSDSSTSGGPAPTSTTGSSGFDGAALPPGVTPPAFTLRDERGAPASLSSYPGQVIVVAFLSSNCGATCVVIAQQIRGALDELPQAVPVLVISADPQADTPAHVAHFLAQTSLTGRVRWLSGTQAQLRRVWHAFRVLPASAGHAAFARSTSVFVIDRDGHERVIFQLEQLTPEALAHDVGKLLEA